MRAIDVSVDEQKQGIFFPKAEHILSFFKETLGTIPLPYVSCAS